MRNLLGLDEVLRVHKRECEAAARDGRLGLRVYALRAASRE
jgi:hypothetical protein